MTKPFSISAIIKTIVKRQEPIFISFPDSKNTYIRFHMTYFKNKKNYLLLRLADPNRMQDSQAQEGQRLKIIFNKDNGIYSFETEIKSVSPQRLLISVPTELTFHQKRLFPRYELPTTESAFYFKDISLSGVLLVCKVPFTVKKKDIIETLTEIPLMNTRPIQHQTFKIQLEALRIIPSREYAIGCRFLHLNKPTAQAIDAYLASLDSYQQEGKSIIAIQVKSAKKLNFFQKLFVF